MSIPHVLLKSHSLKSLLFVGSSWLSRVPVSLPQCGTGSGGRPWSSVSAASCSGLTNPYQISPVHLWQVSPSKRSYCSISVMEILLRALKFFCVVRIYVNAYLNSAYAYNIMSSNRFCIYIFYLYLRVSLAFHHNGQPHQAQSLQVL